MLYCLPHNDIHHKNMVLTWLLQCEKPRTLENPGLVGSVIWHDCSNVKNMSRIQVRKHLQFVVQVLHMQHKKLFQKLFFIISDHYLTGTGNHVTEIGECMLRPGVLLSHFLLSFISTKKKKINVLSTVAVIVRISPHNIRDEVQWGKEQAGGQISKRPRVPFSNPIGLHYWAEELVTLLYWWGLIWQIGPYNLQRSP